MKSILKRIFSMTVMLVMLSTGMNLSFISFARAEGSAGGMSVSNTPETLLTMGEWQYWVEDGKAYVAGYLNPDEQKLTIPYNLGGYPVVGIGHGAFSTNAALKTIQIHTNVTEIASDAFAVVSVLTIAAYHGAYALDYAVAKGIKANNLSNVAVFADGAIDLTGLSSKAYFGLTDDHVTFNSDEATFLKIGQVLYFPEQSGYPTGLAKKVSDMSVSGGKTSVLFSQPEWGEVFISVSGSDQLILDWKNIELNEGFELTDFSSSSVDSDATFNIKFKIGKEVTVTGSMKVVIEQSTIEYDIGWQWWGIVRIPDIKYIKATIPIKTTNSIEVKYKDKDDSINESSSD